MKWAGRAFVAGALFLLASAAWAGPVTVEDVIAMVQGGLGEQAIIAKVKSSGRTDLSTQQMIALKKAGVSDAIIAAMLGGADAPAAGAPAVAAAPVLSVDSPDPAILHPTGIYLLDDTATAPKMIRMEATISDQAKTGGIIGHALTNGISSLSIKAVVQGEHARIATSARKPVFYLFFPESNPNSGGQTGAWLSGTAATINSPNELTLIQFVSKKDKREIRVGSFNIGGVKSGVMDKDRIAFGYTLIRPGVYKVTPDNALEPGEYGFLYALGNSGAAGAMSARIFDFSVQ